MTRLRPTIQEALILVCCACLPAAAAVAGDKIVLSDGQLNGIVAGAASTVTSDELSMFSAEKTTQSGLVVSAQGSFALADSIDRATLGNLVMTDGAQGNLRSVINVTAVNSVVNVLLNLNISINSNVGAIRQFNLNGAVPALPARSTGP